MSSWKTGLTVSGPVLVVNAPLTTSAHATTDKLTTKAQKITIKLPWEIVTIFSDVLPADEEEDEDNSDYNLPRDLYQIRRDRYGLDSDGEANDFGDY